MLISDERGGGKRRKEELRERAYLKDTVVALDERVQPWRRAEKLVGTRGADRETKTPKSQRKRKMGDLESRVKGNRRKEKEGGLLTLPNKSEGKERRRVRLS